MVLGGLDPSFNNVYPSVIVPGRQSIGKITLPNSLYTLDVSGNINASGAVTQGSDYRIKENIETLNATFTVDNLRPVTYHQKITGKQDIGLIAHELQEHYPFLVNGEKDGEDMQSVNYIGLIGILIKEIQDLKVKVKHLEETINK
jgi:hypothetical protein